ncbi:MAG: epimerase [Cupriavidus sp.]|jgi:dTDP-6-deoxy-L-talose 4-dehydrogenase (NAD+)|nr:epimerase [Cupriavidus sp.]
MRVSQVIVTGATGFVGQHVVPQLLERGLDVVAVARDEAKARTFDWHKDVRFIELDYHKKRLNFIPTVGSTLIHLAWQGLPNYKSMFHIDENLPRNYDFIRDLVAEGVSKVLVTGTCFEYGLQSGPIPSNSTTKPTNPYGIAKDCLRRYLESLSVATPFTLQWARLFYMHGKGQNPKSILALLDSAIANGDRSFNMSGGEQLRDYLPVESVARRIIELHLGDTGGTFNVCSGEPISIRRLVEERVKQRGADIELNLGYYPYPDYEPMAFWGAKE